MKLCVLLSFLAGASALILHRPGNCMNRCFLRNDYSHECQCDSDCESVGNCCPDFWTRCRGPETGLVVTAQELNTYAQSIWDNDINRIDTSAYTLSYQTQINRTFIGDVSANALFSQAGTNLDTNLADNSSTYPYFIQLLDNYAINVRHAEHRPHGEIAEENRFWNAAMKTKVMNLTFSFLVNNGFIRGDYHAFRTVVNELWFELYPKAHASVLSDSGFEHVMIGQIAHTHASPHHNASSHVAGFHNWIQYYLQEKAGNINYDGYITNTQDPNIGYITFTWNNATARGVSFFVGTSPEFDMSIYTVCALARPNTHCNFQINGQQIVVQTNVQTHKQIKQITAAFPRLQAPASATP